MLSVMNTIQEKSEDTAQEILAEHLLSCLQEFLTDLKGGAETETVSLDSQFQEELGMDSISKVEFLSEIEHRLGVSLKDDEAILAPTPRDLLRAMGPQLGEQQLMFSAENLKVVPTRSVEKHAPLTALSLIEVLDWHAHTHGSEEHIIFLDASKSSQILTYEQLAREAEQVARGLISHGVEQREVVALMLPTSLGFFTSFFGILLAGAIPVPLYPPGKFEQIEEHLMRHEKILQNAGAKLLLTTTSVIPFGHLLKLRLSHLQEVISVENIRSASLENTPTVACKANDIALIQYTSGSTGDPKGVVLTHQNLLSNIQAMGQVIKAHAEDVFVSWLPLYHDMGLIGAWLGSLFYGSKLVVMSPLSFLARPARWLWAMSQYRGTLSAAPNFAYEICASRLSEAQLEGLDLSSWRVAFNGSEPVSADTFRRFTTRFSSYGFKREAMTPVYGLAENSVGLSFPPLDRGPQIDAIERDTFQRLGRAVPIQENSKNSLLLVSCGKPLPDHEIRIVNEKRNELQEREEGRIEFRSPSATSGYYHNEEATRQLFHDSWLDTGDFGYLFDFARFHRWADSNSIGYTSNTEKLLLCIVSCLSLIVPIH